jgi:pSer/pThr/pTyr-binding forkhead associated (FHA) protein
MAVLYQIGNDGSRAGRWEIDAEPIVVGRGGQAKVSIKDDGLSRRHFLIVREGAGYVIKDLNSRNGTWLEGRRVLAERLRDNDRIQAGRTQFLFAERPALPAAANKPLTGPHGTILISAGTGGERSFSQSMLWQSGSDRESQAHSTASN